MNRREFVTLASVGGAIACSPEIVSAASESQKSKETKNFVQVATVAEVKDSLLIKKSPVGPLLLIKNADGKTINAVNPTCPHEHCTVQWKKDQELLVCPCHKAAFTETGIVKKGPAKKDLTTYKVKLEGDNILVKA